MTPRELPPPETPVETASSRAQDQKTYWSIVIAQFRKQRIAMFGLWVISLLFLTAICAPLLATSSPFYLNKDGDAFLAAFDRNDDGRVTRTECPDEILFDEVDMAADDLRDGVASAEDVAAWGRPRFPWFADLFDQNIWSSGVDLYFNLLLALMIPFAVVVWLARGRRGKALLACGAVHLAAFLFTAGPEPIAFLRYSSTKQDYVGRVLFVRHELVRARSKNAFYDRQLAEAEQALENARDTWSDDLEGKERADAEAILLAAQDEYDRMKRNQELWESNIESVREKLEQPVYQFTWVRPPVGFHPKDKDTEMITSGPSYGGWGLSHYLGTDTVGRDVLSRILYGARVSLTIGVIAVAIYCTIGAIVGSIMGYFGGRVDMILMRFVEIMMCFPRLPFILIIVAVFSRSIYFIMVAIGIVGWAGVARLIRGQFFAERGLDYVTAARALGIPEFRIVFKHVLPNAIHPMFVSATFGVAAAIIAESGLAFLGLGDPNVPSWGQMLLKGRETASLWLIYSPGFAIFVTVTSLNLVGEGLRDALDPKLRQ